MPFQLPDYHADGIIRLQPADLVAAVGCTLAIAEVWAVPLSGAAVLHNINTPKRIAPWLATIAHESAGLTTFTERMSYSAQRLTEVWGNRFRFPRDGEHGDDDTFADGMRNAYQYANNPTKLADYVYDDANRAPQHRLGNTEPGDGSRFLGRGPIQITGRDNYTRCGRAIGVDLLRWPDMLLEPPVGAHSAGWFWEDRGLNTYADAGDFETITRKVSGARTGFDDRATRLAMVQTALERFTHGSVV